MREKIICALLMVIVGLALAITLNRQPVVRTEPAVSKPAVSPLPTAHPAEVYRARRREEREAEKALLSLLPEEERKEEILRLTALQELELSVEAALSGMGDPWGLCVADERGATVFLSVPLSGERAALILDMIQEISGFSPENIRMTGC